MRPPSVAPAAPPPASPAAAPSDRSTCAVSASRHGPPAAPAPTALATCATMLFSCSAVRAAGGRGGAAAADEAWRSGCKKS
eukprot:358111-Chlamydomonas_euryale.AAC.1